MSWNPTLFHGGAVIAQAPTGLTRNVLLSRSGLALKLYNYEHIFSYVLRDPT